MSSTAIALQSLKEKGLMSTAAGQQSFAVLLFQDIAVIPILALLPLLATAPAVADGHGGSGLSHQPGWVQTLALAAAVGGVVAAGRFVVVPALRVVAKTRLRELFTASALLIVVATALLMQKVGLSPALGTFLAGVVLATSEFKHELESDLDPFKGLLLGLFFMGVGASIDFRLIASQPGQIALLTRDDDAMFFVDFVRVARGGRGGADPGPEHTLVEQDEERGEGHAERGHGQQGPGHRRIDKAELCGEGEEDEGELADLREAEREDEVLIGRKATAFPEGEQKREL
jgi:hypothetical protein